MERQERTYANMEATDTVDTKQWSNALVGVAATPQFNGGRETARAQPRSARSYVTVPVVPFL
ncbi:hypothetical protein RR48_07971 [Papilio machaon]|uniref:Uncharacterized protein n=1 Tax=Papilio machaon TaxID=76193 RepID=A0A194QP46_PAPMA|nr:hypothetical protein RR48_07971 [Papilio machaon]